MCSIDLSFLFSSSRKDDSPKTWRSEPDAVRKESVIKSVVKEVSKPSSDVRINRDTRTNVEPRSVKLDYQMKDEETFARAEGKSPPVFSRGHDVTTRPSDPQSFVTSSSLRGKGVDNPHYTNGTPSYSHLSSRRVDDPTSSHRKDLRVHDIEKRGYLDTSKDHGRIIMDKGRINGVKDSPEKVRDVGDSKSRDANDHEDPYIKYLKAGDRFFEEKGERRRYSEELLYRHRMRNQEAFKRHIRREDMERDRSSPTAGSIRESPERLKSNFPVSTAHSVETIMNGRANTSPGRSREEVRTRHEWDTRRNPTGGDHRVVEVSEPKLIESASDLSREQRMMSRGQQSRDDNSRGQRMREDHEDSVMREQRLRKDDGARGPQLRESGPRGQRSREADERSRVQNLVPRDPEPRSRDQSSEKDDSRMAEIERLRYEAGNEHVRTGRPPFFDPRVMNPGITDHRGVDSRLYVPSNDRRYPGFDPRKYESPTRDSSEVKTKRTLGDQNEEKRHSEERVSRRNDDRPLPEHLRSLQNNDGRPRSAPQCSTRSMSPRVNGNTVKQSRTEREVKSRGVDGSSDSNETKKNDLGDNPIGNWATSKRSPYKDEPVDDVIVSQSNESSRASYVPRPGPELSASNPMRAGVGNLVIPPSGTGYSNIPMFNSEAYYRLLQAHNEGRLPPFLYPLPNGVFPSALPDPNHAAMFSNEYIKAWSEMFRGK